MSLPPALTPPTSSLPPPPPTKVLSGVLSDTIRLTEVDASSSEAAALDDASGDSIPVQASCLALGPCPCVGSYLALPAVTSVILGDDFFVRLTSSSLER